MDATITERTEEGKGTLSGEEFATGPWLSLVHFPENTRVQLSKRGRSYIFRSPTNNVVIDLIGRATWNRYRSNTETPIPLSSIKSILNEDEKELFLISFSVTALGSQKLQLPIRLPIKVTGNAGLMRVLALMCLARHVFTTGNFQTDSEEKADAFIESFKRVFGVELPKGMNKRGNYVRIPKQLVQAFLTFFTGESEDVSVPAILETLLTFPKEDKLAFLNTWFSFYRVYRNPKSPDQLFMFRCRNKTTDLIAQLMEKCDLEFDPGTIQEAEAIVSVYVIKNTPKNLALLNLPFLEEKGPGTYKTSLDLLRRIEDLKEQITTKDETITVLEQHAEKLREELGKEQQAKYFANYSRYYFESKTKLLEDQFEELRRVSEQIKTENRELKSLLADLALPDLSSLTEKTLNMVKEEILSSPQVFDLASYNMFVEYMERRSQANEPSQGTTKPVILVMGEESEDESDQALLKSNLTNPALAQKLIRVLTLLMAHRQNWVVLALTDGTPRTVPEIREIVSNSDIQLGELNRFLSELEDVGIIERFLKGGETAYRMKEQLFREKRSDIEFLLKKKKLPSDVRSLWKELFQV